MRILPCLKCICFTALLDRTDELTKTGCTLRSSRPKKRLP